MDRAFTLHMPYQCQLMTFREPATRDRRLFQCPNYHEVDTENPPFDGTNMYASLEIHTVPKEEGGK
uniref:Uncharacterized protein n=1 Tax=Oryza punctata TaxID=4537 RepID=A0A0E0LYU5_ORYPU